MGNTMVLSALSGGILLSEVNLAGTHDSATAYCAFEKIAKCQNWTFSEQLSNGIRLLDIRLCKKGRRFYLVHGLADCYTDQSKKEKLQFDEVLPKPEQKVESLPRREGMPDDVDTCAAYLAEDGSVGLAWAEGVCALTPMEAQMGQLSLAGKKLIFHDSKTAMHRLDELGIQAGECVFDTALAAYDLNRKI